MKFIHTGDIHWGMAPDSDKPWSRERARDIRETFAAIIGKARELSVDFLFIAGDLFHRQPLLKDLKEVNYLFSTIPDVRVVLIAGNHDRVRKNSAVLSFTWASNVTFLADEEFSSVYFEELHTEVTGFSYWSAEIAEARLNDLSAPDDGLIHILLGHGGDVKHVPVDREALLRAGFPVFHAGTKGDGNGRILTAGGRVLGVTAVGGSLEEAIETAYAACKPIAFQDMHFRTDIGKV